MDSNTFLISDLHLCHDRILEADPPIRPFNNLDMMHAAIINNWNSVVRDGDLVIVVGDVLIYSDNKEKLAVADEILSELNGGKILVSGNHDVGYPRQELYRKHFNLIYGAYSLHENIITHIPVHPACLEHRWKRNIHGHLHHLSVLTPEGAKDKRYVNVSCEAVNFTPRSLKELTWSSHE